MPDGASTGTSTGKPCSYIAPLSILLLLIAYCFTFSVFYGVSWVAFEAKPLQVPPVSSINSSIFWCAVASTSRNGATLDGTSMSASGSGRHSAATSPQSPPPEFFNISLKSWMAQLAASPEPPIAFSVPEACLDLLGKVDQAAVTSCINTLASSAAARPALADKCWPEGPPSSRPIVRLSDEDIMSITPANCSDLPDWAVFHTVSLGRDKPSPVLGPFLFAFLATQCCSAELWIWTTSALTRETLLSDYEIPTQHHHRIRVLPFDPAEQWRALSGDAVFRDAIGPRRSGEKIIVGDYFKRARPPNQADVARMLLLQRYGGTYIDLDALPMQDLRPLLAWRDAFAYRWSCSGRVNTALTRWGSCGSNVSYEITSAVIRTIDAKHVSHNAFYNSAAFKTLLRLNALPAWAGRFGVIPSALADPLWPRVQGHGCEPPSLAAFHPEMRNFEGFYAKRASGPVQPDELLFGGILFVNHVHNAERENRAAMTPGTWAYEVFRRHRELVRDKQC